MAIALLIVHGLVAVACSGRLHTRRSRLGRRRTSGQVPSSSRFRTVPAASFANAIVVLYVLTATLGAILYLDFRVDVRPALERDGHWPALGLFDIKEHFISIGLGLLPAYWVFWRRPDPDEPTRTRAALTLILAVIVWWGFLVGHVLNNIMGFGS